MVTAMKRSLPNLSIVASLALLTLTGTGCTILEKRIGEPIHIDQAELQEGITDVPKTIALLGPPTHMSALPDGMVMVYEYVDANERQLGVNLDFLGLNWFKFSFGTAQANHEGLLLIFDSGGLLRAQDYQKRTEKLGSGLGFQLFVVVMPTVDTRYLNVKPEQFRWGRAALEPLPVTLNASQSLLSGANGIEMRGTPDSVGQRSLEMKTLERRKKRSE